MSTRKSGTDCVKNKITAVDIGPPTDMRQHIHVTKNPETGRLEGLPKKWSKLWDKLSSTSKQDKNPEVAQTTTKFYTLEKNKGPGEPSRISAEIKKEEEEQEFIYGP